MPVAEKLRPSGRIAFTHPNFTLFLTARSLIVLALEMQSVAVGWQVYDITRKPLDLGLIGLAQFTPSLLLFLVSGHVADRVNRRRLLTMCYVGFATCSAAAFRHCIAFGLSARRPADLRCRGTERHRALLQRPRDARHSSTTGARGAFCQRGRLEFERQPNREHPRAHLSAAWFTRRSEDPPPSMP